MVSQTKSEPLTFDRMLTEDEAAAALGLKSQTLSAWRSLQRYDLPYVRVGRLVRYRLSDVQAFVNRNTVGASR